MVEVNEVLHTECYDTALPADGGGSCAVCIRACSYKEPPAVVLYWDDRAGSGRERDARRGDEPLHGAQMLGQYVLANYEP